MLLGGCDDLSDQPWVSAHSRFGRDADPRHAARDPLASGAGARISARRRSRATSRPTARPIPTTPTTRRTSPTDSPTGSSRSAAWSSSRSNCRSPISAPCRRARRSPGTTASRAGAASANGRACRSARCSRRRSSSLTRATSCSIAPTISAETGTEDGKYYESIALVDAFHPQTILAYEMNDQTLPVPHGAPLAAARRAAARLQDGEIRDADRSGGRDRRHPRRPRRLLGRSRL